MHAALFTFTIQIFAQNENLHSLHNGKEMKKLINK